MAETLGLSQRLAALDRANEIRVVRAQLKRDLKAGRVNVLDVLENPPESVHTMKVMDLLLATPKFGRVKAAGLLQHAMMPSSKSLGGMSCRQRDALIAAIIGQ